MTGWIKIHRQITDNPLWNDKPFADGQAWIDLLLAVTFDRGSIKVKNGQRIELRRGECGYSNQTLANRWGWSRGKVTRFLLHLENEKMIQQKKVSNFNVIKVLNFDNFQNDTTNDTTNSTTNGHQTIQQTDTIKNVKNVENVKKERNIIALSQNFNPDLMFDKNINKIFDFYENNCKALIPLKFEKRDLELRQTIKDFLIFIDFDFDYFFDLCQKANEQVFLLDNKIDLKSLIKNHSRIYSGFFNTKTETNATNHDAQRENRIRELERNWKNGKNNNC